MMDDVRVDIVQPDAQGFTPFHSSCKNNHVSVVKLLLDDERSDPNKATFNGRTPFHSACTHGNESIVRILMEDSRIDINKAHPTYGSPFYSACKRRRTGRQKKKKKECLSKKTHISIIKLLIEDDRCDTTTIGTDGKTVFHLMCENKTIQFPSADGIANGITHYDIIESNNTIIAKILLDDSRIDFKKLTMVKQLFIWHVLMIYQWFRYY